MKVLAYTVTHHDRWHFSHTIPLLRGTAGAWYDLLLFMGAAGEDQQVAALRLLEDPQHLGVQHLTIWDENRGQHHATNEALKLAREGGYDWLLRLDDDVTPKTKDWLKKMLARLTELRDLAKDEAYRLVAAPKIVGLKNPLRPTGTMNLGQRYMVDVMEKLGGACRLMPVPLLEGYQANVYDPVGRGDPEGIMLHCQTRGGMQVRFPDIRLIHSTSTLEGQDAPEQAHLRRMSKVWPWLESASV